MTRPQHIKQQYLDTVNTPKGSRFKAKGLSKDSALAKRNSTDVFKDAKKPKHVVDVHPATTKRRKRKRKEQKAPECDEFIKIITDANVEYSIRNQINTRGSQQHPKILVILDLNGTIIWRDILHKPIGGTRPHLLEFLAALLVEFEVAVWTSCTDSNGQAIINTVFKEAKQELVFEKFRSSCTELELGENTYSTWKDLAVLWDENPNYTAHNTLLIDDSPSKVHADHMKNAIIVPTFHSGGETNALLLQLLDYLRFISKCCPDVRDRPPFLPTASYAGDKAFAENPPIIKL